MDKIEYTIGKYLKNNDNLVLILILLFSLPISIVSFDKYGLFFSIFIFINIFVFTHYFLNNFIKKYLNKNREKWLLTLIKEGGFSEEKIVNIISLVMSNTIKKLLINKLSPTNETTMYIFVDEFKKLYSLKISLKEFNIFKKSVHDFNDEIYEYVVENYYKLKLKGQ
jgi:hypothetical protein